MTIEVNDVTKDEALASIGRLIECESQGRISFDRNGDKYSVYASSETEPISS